MAGHDIIVIGASAGGVEPLVELVHGLPADLPAAIFVVLHLSTWGKSCLPTILKNRTGLAVAHAVDREAIVPGRIYIAPPNYHLLVTLNLIRLVQGPKENGFRPAIDPLFRTAAIAYGPRVVGVVLSGMLDDGTAGLTDIKRQGGLVIVQDPNEALFPSMPQTAIDHVTVDQVLSAANISSMLNRLAYEPIVEVGGTGVDLGSPKPEMEPNSAELAGRELRQHGTPGTAAGILCPDCGGSLYQFQECQELLQFRCRVGHAWSAGSLAAGQLEAQEQALWMAIYSLEERTDLMLRLAQNARDRNSVHSAERFEDQAQTARKHANVVRLSLMQGQHLASIVKADEKSSRLDRATEVVVFVAAAEEHAALNSILSALPATFSAAMIVLQALDSQGSILTALPTQPAKTGKLLQPGRLYLAPTDQHVVVNPDATFSLLQTSFVAWEKPSADLLLQSVAATFKQRSIAVILGENAQDDSLGLRAIHAMSGKIIVQAVSTCQSSQLPQNAIEAETSSLTLPLSEIAPTLCQLAMDMQADRQTYSRCHDR